MNFLKQFLGPQESAPPEIGGAAVLRSVEYGFRSALARLAFTVLPDWPTQPYPGLPASPAALAEAWGQAVGEWGCRLDRQRAMVECDLREAQYALHQANRQLSEQAQTCAALRQQLVELEGRPLTQRLRQLEQHCQTLQQQNQQLQDAVHTHTAAVAQQARAQADWEKERAELEALLLKQQDLLNELQA